MVPADCTLDCLDGYAEDSGGCYVCACKAPPDGADPKTSPDYGASTCARTVDAACGSSGCASWPSTRGAWCASGTLPPNPMASIGGSCNGWEVVESVSGDQATDYFYAADGTLAAVAAWSSQAPCEGSCTLGCLAGPADLDLTALGACVNALRWDVACE